MIAPTHCAGGCGGELYGKENLCPRCEKHGKQVYVCKCCSDEYLSDLCEECRDEVTVLRASLNSSDYRADERWED